MLPFKKDKIIKTLLIDVENNFKREEDIFVIGGLIAEVTTGIFVQELECFIKFSGIFLCVL